MHLFFFAGCNQKKEINLDSKSLLKEKCSICHNLDMPPHTFENEKAPPMMNGCLSCHAKKFKKVGPSFENIARKRNNKEIANSIKNGSKGGWKNSNNIPMPSFKKLSNKNINILAKWIKKN